MKVIAGMELEITYLYILIQYVSHYSSDSGPLFTSTCFSAVGEHILVGSNAMTLELFLIFL